MGALALPPTAGGVRQAQQLAAWMAYLSWERSNYQRLEQAAYISRVVRAVFALSLGLRVYRVLSPALSALCTLAGSSALWWHVSQMPHSAYTRMHTIW